MGHPVLRQRARELTAAELADPALSRLVADMVDTLHDYGGIGLAAPQVGESIRLLIIEIPGGRTRYGEQPPLPLSVFVNPTVEYLGDERRGYWEGCLSVPGLRGFVERPQRIRVACVDAAGQPRQLELGGFQATVFQHEYDHLDGVLYVDRISDRSRLAFEDEYVRYHTGDAID